MAEPERFELSVRLYDVRRFNFGPGELNSFQALLGPANRYLKPARSKLHIKIITYSIMVVYSYIESVVRY